MATMKAPAKLTQMNAPAKPTQIRLTRRSPAYWRVTIDNPPINVMGPEMVKQFQEVINALEADEQVRVVVFDSAVDDYFLNHSPISALIPFCERGFHKPGDVENRLGYYLGQIAR